jgi:hypothetical protein
VNPSRADFQEVTQKVKNKKKHNDKSRVQQGFPADIREPNKIAASTRYNFRGKHLTPYGGRFRWKPPWLLWSLRVCLFCCMVSVWRG